MIATPEELLAAGINQVSPFTSERRKGSPGRWRIDSTLVIRRNDGGIECFYGYFTPTQELARRKFAAEFSSAFDGIRRFSNG